MPTNSQSLKRNRLKRVLKVQADFKQWKREGETKKRIWQKHIADTWKIEYHTFIIYLCEDAAGKLAALEAEILATEKEKPQREITRVERLKRRVWELEANEVAALFAYMVHRFPGLATNGSADPVAASAKPRRPRGRPLEGWSADAGA